MIYGSELMKILSMESIREYRRGRGECGERNFKKKSKCGNKIIREIR
jgi:hypothetical protein